MHGVMFGILGAKGGVGASLLSVNLAAVLAGAGKTLLIDLQPLSGGDDLLLDVSPDNSWFDLLFVLGEINANHLKQACIMHDSGLAFLAAPAAWPRSGEWKKVPGLLAELKHFYDWILVDLSPRAPEEINLWDVLSSCLLVLTPDPPALRSGKRWLHAMPVDVQEKTQLVLSQISTHHPANPQKIAASLGTQLLCTLPIDVRAVGYQVNFGASCVHDRGSPFGKAVWDLAQRIVRDRSAHPRVRSGIPSRMDVGQELK
ncbi:MAG: CpaE family protein [Anaerolineales bacterium]